MNIANVNSFFVLFYLVQITKELWVVQPSSTDYQVLELPLTRRDLQGSSSECRGISSTISTLFLWRSNSPRKLKHASDIWLLIRKRLSLWSPMLVQKAAAYSSSSSSSRSHRTPLPSLTSCRSIWRTHCYSMGRSSTCASMLWLHKSAHTLIASQ